MQDTMTEDEIRPLLSWLLHTVIDKGFDKDGYIIYLLGRIRDGMPIRASDYYHIIFSHDFAKALWGEATKFIWYCDGEAIDELDIADLPSPDVRKEEWWNQYEPANGWQYHLGKMVLEEEPLKYLKEVCLSEEESNPAAF